MSTCNRANLLAVTIASIVKQDFFDLEFVVVDDGDDDETQQICKSMSLAYPFRYFKLNREGHGFKNPSRPNNVGIRNATGDIIILQNPECMHIDPKSIKRLTDSVTDTNVVFARVTAIAENGDISTIYCGRENPRPYFFCGALKRSWLVKLRGFDEDFVGYGYEDDDLSDRLRSEGLNFVFTDIDVYHQWHKPVGKQDMSQTSVLYKQKQGQHAVRNLNREWGAL